MTRRRRSGWALGLLWCAVSVAVIGFQGGDRDRAKPRVGPPSFRATPPQTARRGVFPHEEWYVRDVYARLMRYDFAARQIAASETGVMPEPDAYLVVSVRRMRTRDVELGNQVRRVEAVPTDRTLTLQRVAWCHDDDPCHASYHVAWDSTAGGAVRAVEARAFSGSVTRVTTYEVTLTLSGTTRTYAAEVRYHVADDGIRVEPEVVDPVVPGLQQVADDEAPLAVRSWDRYVKTRRYAAVVERVRSRWRAGQRAVPEGAPVGALPGDDVSPQDEQRVMLLTSGVPCVAGGLSVRADNVSLRPDGSGSPSATTIYVMTDPPTPGVTVTLTLAGERNSGGHMDDHHVGPRPAGTLSATSMITGATGGGHVSYVAPVIGERVTVTVRTADAQVTLTLEIQVPGLVELGPGAHYTLIGFDHTPAHPEGTNHWGTPYANGKLAEIAQAYQAAFPGAGPLLYNDQSLPWGGRFDSELRNWSTGGHGEHRLGTNCDVDSTAVPTSRWAALSLIFFEHGASSVLDETADNHWHVRF